MMSPKKRKTPNKSKSPIRKMLVKKMINYYDILEKVRDQNANSIKRNPKEALYVSQPSKRDSPVKKREERINRAHNIRYYRDDIMHKKKLLELRELMRAELDRMRVEDETFDMYDQESIKKSVSGFPSFMKESRGLLHDRTMMRKDTEEACQEYNMRAERQPLGKTLEEKVVHGLTHPISSESDLHSSDVDLDGQDEDRLFHLDVKHHYIHENDFEKDKHDYLDRKSKEIRRIQYSAGVRDRSINPKEDLRRRKEPASVTTKKRKKRRSSTKGKKRRRKTRTKKKSSPSKKSRARSRRNFSAVQPFEVDAMSLKGSKNSSRKSSMGDNGHLYDIARQLSKSDLKRKDKLRLIKELENVLEDELDKMNILKQPLKRSDPEEKHPIWIEYRKRAFPGQMKCINGFKINGNDEGLLEVREGDVVTVEINKTELTNHRNSPYAYGNLPYVFFGEIRRPKPQEKDCDFIVDDNEGTRYRVLISLRESDREDDHDSMGEAIKSVDLHPIEAETPPRYKLQSDFEDANEDEEDQGPAEKPEPIQTTQGKPIIRNIDNANCDVYDSDGVFLGRGKAKMLESQDPKNFTKAVMLDNDGITSLVLIKRQGVDELLIKDKTGKKSLEYIEREESKYLPGLDPKAKVLTLKTFFSPEKPKVIFFIENISFISNSPCLHNEEVLVLCENNEDFEGLLSPHSEDNHLIIQTGPEEEERVILRMDDDKKLPMNEIQINSMLNSDSIQGRETVITSEPLMNRILIKTDDLILDKIDERNRLYPQENIIEEPVEEDETEDHDYVMRKKSSSNFVKAVEPIPVTSEDPQFEDEADDTNQPSSDGEEEIVQIKDMDKEEGEEEGEIVEIEVEIEETVDGNDEQYETIEVEEEEEEEDEEDDEETKALEELVKMKELEFEKQKELNKIKEEEQRKLEEEKEKLEKAREELKDKEEEMKERDRERAEELEREKERVKEQQDSLEEERKRLEDMMDQLKKMHEQQMKSLQEQKDKSKSSQRSSKASSRKTDRKSSYKSQYSDRRSSKYSKSQRSNADENPNYQKSKTSSRISNPRELRNIDPDHLEETNDYSLLQRTAPVGLRNVQPGEEQEDSYHHFSTGPISLRNVDPYYREEHVDRFTKQAGQPIEILNIEPHHKEEQEEFQVHQEVVQEPVSEIQNEELDRLKKLLEDMEKENLKKVEDIKRKLQEEEDRRKDEEEKRKEAEKKQDELEKEFERKLEEHKRKKEEEERQRQEEEDRLRDEEEKRRQEEEDRKREEAEKERLEEEQRLQEEEDERQRLAEEKEQEEEQEKSRLEEQKQREYEEQERKKQEAREAEEERQRQEDEKKRQEIQDEKDRMQKELEEAKKKLEDDFEEERKILEQELEDERKRLEDEAKRLQELEESQVIVEKPEMVSRSIQLSKKSSSKPTIKSSNNPSEQAQPSNNSSIYHSQQPLPSNPSTKYHSQQPQPSSSSRNSNKKSRRSIAERRKQKQFGSQNSQSKSKKSEEDPELSTFDKLKKEIKELEERAGRAREDLERDWKSMIDAAQPEGQFEDQEEDDIKSSKYEPRISEPNFKDLEDIMINTVEAVIIEEKEEEQESNYTKSKNSSIKAVNDPRSIRRSRRSSINKTPMSIPDSQASDYKAKAHTVHPGFLSKPKIQPKFNDAESSISRLRNASRNEVKDFVENNVRPSRRNSKVKSKSSLMKRGDTDEFTTPRQESIPHDNVESEMVNESGSEAGVVESHFGRINLNMGIGEEQDIEFQGYGQVKITSRGTSPSKKPSGLRLMKSKTKPKRKKGMSKTTFTRKFMDTTPIKQKEIYSASSKKSRDRRLELLEELRKLEDHAARTIQLQYRYKKRKEAERKKRLDMSDKETYTRFLQFYKSLPEGVNYNQATVLFKSMMQQIEAGKN